MTFIVRLDVINRIMEMESVESIGVRTVPLRNYNATGKGYPGRILLGRHQDFQQKEVISLSQKTVDLFGSPYNTEQKIN